MNSEQNLAKTNINWYPGHMAKTKKQIIEDLKLVDIIVEILDARIPLASQNPDLKEMIKDKTRLVILNKSDLACENENKKWKGYFEKQNVHAVLVDSVSGKGLQDVLKTINTIYDSKKYESKGRVGKSIRIMVVGIPNVGKSSFINRMAKKTVAQVGNKPGVTKQKQWIKVSNQIELLDTPGVLWPKLQNNEVALNLAFTGTIKEDILQTLDIGYELLKRICKNYKENLIQRYKLNEEDVINILEDKTLKENERIIKIMHIIGQKRGAILPRAE